jgi:hypothetical protein
MSVIRGCRARQQLAAIKTNGQVVEKSRQTNVERLNAPVFKCIVRLLSSRIARKCICGRVQPPEVFGDGFFARGVISQLMPGLTSGWTLCRTQRHRSISLASSNAAFWRSGVLGVGMVIRSELSRDLPCVLAGDDLPM